MPVALALARRDGPPSNAARRGLAFRAGTRASDGNGQNVLQPSVLCGVSAPAFCFAEWNMRRDVHQSRCACICAALHVVDMVKSLPRRSLRRRRGGSPVTATATALARYQMFIGGQWVEASSRDHFESDDPFRAEPWALIPRGTAEDVDRAVGAAHRAFTSCLLYTSPS